MITNIPYNTTYGSLINNKKTIDALLKYLIVADNNLNYEYINASETRLVIITGKNETEQSLPIWEFPLVFQDVKDNTIVAVDARMYVDVKREQDFTNVESIVKDKSAFTFKILNALLVADLLSESYDRVIPTEASVTTGATLWLSESISTLVMLNPTEKVTLELVINAYFHKLFINGKMDKSLEEVIKMKVSRAKLSLPVNNAFINNVLTKIDFAMDDVNSLVDNIKAALNSDKGNMISSDVIVSAVSNSWYGPGTSETSIVALENLPTLMTLLYAALSDKTYKRSRVSTILDKYKRKIDDKKYIKHMEIYLSESIF